MSRRTIRAGTATALAVCALAALDAAAARKPDGPSLTGPAASGKPATRRIDVKRGAGKQANGRALKSVDVHHPTPASVTLRAVTDAGKALTGAELVGATLLGKYGAGQATTVKISAHDATTTAPLDLYLVKDESGAGICGEADGKPIWASPIDVAFDDKGAEIADPALFSFACRSGAVQRCQEYGYPRSGTRVEATATTTRSRSLGPYHAACVRMLRADYCGDGQAHTQEGTPIDVRDNLGILAEQKAAESDAGAWTTEAEWAPDGAWCIDHTRWMPQGATTQADNVDPAKNPHFEHVKKTCPWRIAGHNDGVHPVRPCGDASTYRAANGFDLADQTSRSLLANASPLYREP